VTFSKLETAAGTRMTRRVRLQSKDANNGLILVVKTTLLPQPGAGAVIQRLTTPDLYEIKIGIDRVRLGQPVAV
jgi:hypothetical protein